MELQQQLTELITEQKSFIAKADGEFKSLGTVTTETKTRLDAIQTQVDAIDKKLVDRIGTPGAEQKSLAEVLKENDDVARIVRDKKGRAVFTLTGEHSRIGEVKTITTPAIVTPGVVDADRMQGIVTEARRTLRVRDVLSSRPTTLPLVYWVKVNSPLVNASPQVEASSKFENAVTFTTANSPVKTIATFIKASRQALDDFAELAGFLQTGLPYYVNKDEEDQLLSGDNTGENLNGLTTQATSFDTSLLSAAAGYTRIDQVGAAIEQVNAIDEVDPTFIIMNRKDWWKLRRTKDSFGRYILGDPQSIGNPTLWGLTPVATNAIAQGTFLVGSGNAAATEIRDRMEMQVDISTEDSDNFQRNLVTIRAEKRLVLCVMRPASFITGTFATSPAS
jgi:HK97 family phage major capsid protein